jgi:hypothetical protein
MKDIILHNTIKNSSNQNVENVVYKALEKKRKLRYYKNVINSNVEDQNDIYVLTSVKKKISIPKIRINSQMVKCHGMK